MTDTLGEAQGHSNLAPPQPVADAAPIPEPRDTPYPGTLTVHVPATDVVRGIFRVRQTLPVTGPGKLVILYPKWLPGFHAPQAPIELFGGLRISASGTTVRWTRHPVTVNAFYVDVPVGADGLELEFQFLSPTDPSQGRVLCSEAMLFLPWNAVVLYPGGHFARQITVAPSLTLPPEWGYTSALDQVGSDGPTIEFAPVPLDVLVDSPVLAGKHHRRIQLDEAVHLTLTGDTPDLIAPTAEQIAPHRALVEQADRLFGTRHFDRFEMLLALSAELSSAGIEHHQSFEAASVPDYFTGWDSSFPHRDTVSHEYLHSWNGKHRRGADSWSPCFEKPIRNSLMWVYEGLTQYWTNVLCARAGLWTAAQARDAFAVTAARYDVRPGSQWRSIADTTRDPIIAARAPLPWPSWQRSEDYYSEGALIWLDVNTRLRELSGDTRSLDDFARDFFDDGRGGAEPTRVYDFGDVVAALQAVAPFDWAGFLTEALADTHVHAPLGGIARGGYRLAYREEPSPYQAAVDAGSKKLDLTHSLGLTVGADGKFGDVLWDGPAFASGLTIGCTMLGVADRAFSLDELCRAVRAAGEGGAVTLLVAKGKSIRPMTVPSPHGLRFAHLEPAPGARPRLDEILAPRRQ